MLKDYNIAYTYQQEMEHIAAYNRRQKDKSVSFHNIYVNAQKAQSLT